ncbi:MAG: VCBS repeat-containing protein [Deltaproteobacteria bacterium]|nr:VCBS repeat-containing protein [Deltaproteobacteria bacterium]
MVFKSLFFLMAFFIVTLVSLSFEAFAQVLDPQKQHHQAFAGSLWESPLMEGAVMSLAYGNVNGDLIPDILYCTSHKIVAGSFDAGLYQPYAAHKLGSDTACHRISLGDWDHNGARDVLVNVSSGDRFLSALYRVNGDHFVLTQEFDTLVMSVGENGAEDLLSQAWFGQGRWAGMAQKLVYKNQTWVTTNEQLVLSRGLSNNPLSLMTLTRQDNRSVFMTQDHKILVQDHHAKKIWESGMTYGSVVDYIKLNTPDPLGLNRANIFPIPPRMASTGNHLFVIKNDDYLKSIIGKPNIKAGSLVSLEWVEGVGFRERHTSPRYEGALTDLNVVDTNGDGVKEILAAFLVRKMGYLDAYQGQVSQIVILPVNNLQ